MGIPCPGYADPLEQQYRDQSELVIKKAQASYKKSARRGFKTRAFSPNASNVSMPSGSELTSATSPMIEAFCRSLSLQVDAVAVTEFMATYVPQSPFDYLSLVSNSEASLAVTIRAVSLAMSASKLKDFRLLQFAQQLYGTALSNTNTALRMPERVTRDSTLVSVLLLSMFEAMACHMTGTSSNWAAHIRGALSLLRLRGKEQFSNELGRRLFGQMCSILTFDTLMRKTPVPPDLLDLISLARLLHWESPRTLFASLIGEIVTSPCVLRDTHMHPSTKAEKALALDHRVLQFIMELPSDFEYQEIQQELKDILNSGWETYGHTIHQYQHHPAARMWNACRVLRIMLNGVVHRALGELLASHAGWGTRQLAAGNINQAAMDICATVPQFLDPEKYDRNGIEASPEARVSTLIAALSVMKSEPLTLQPARSYAADRLKHLGKKFNSIQAESAANGKGLDVLHGGMHIFYVY